MTKSAQQRFDEKYVIADSGCWLWQAAKNNRGYGVIGYGGGNKIVLAHRLSWMLYRGDVPTGLWVLHKCDIRDCVNPEHLYLGTIKDNARDHMQRGRPYCFQLRKNMTPQDEQKRVQNLRRGSKHHRAGAKINELIARLIFIANGPQREIANKFGLCQQEISKIKTLKTWRHVNG
jgi:hypothetical protein